ncbi:uncharacterized protein LOC110903018 [Helianthus annuus]|uniref:uncharacterized protein LOC110903018 n=1 Tax=Helianthus annuus TaxID=4232 RepID=UPI001652D34E|nr:uncharacterized protein LOC110903018 [Helianthus annuus]
MEAIAPTELGEGCYQVVLVSAKITSSSSEIVGKKLEPREKAFNFCRISTRRRKPERKNQNGNHVALDSNMLGKFDHSWLTTVLFISSEITFEILILFLTGVVSERLDREPTAADVLIAAADIVFSFWTRRGFRTYTWKQRYTNHPAEICKI